MDENTPLECEILGILAEREEWKQKRNPSYRTTSRNLYLNVVGDDSFDCLHRALDKLQQQGKITFESGYENIRLVHNYR
jgi:hypothetical protein